MKHIALHCSYSCTLQFHPHGTAKARLCTFNLINNVVYSDKALPAETVSGRGTFWNLCSRMCHWTLGMNLGSQLLILLKLIRKAFTLISGSMFTLCKWPTTYNAASAVLTVSTKVSKSYWHCQTVQKIYLSFTLSSHNSIYSLPFQFNWHAILDHLSPGRQTQWSTV